MPSTESARNRWTHNITWYLTCITAITVLGPLQFGYHLAELNAPQKAITCEKTIKASRSSTTLPPCIPMTAAQFGLVSSIFTLGGLVGALSAGILSTRYGRLLTMRLTTAFFVAGPIFEALASDVPVFAVGRTLSGLGAGASIVVVPVYISETAPPTEKGLFGSLTQISINLGIVCTQFLGLFLSRPRLWRVILGVGGGIGLLQLLGLYAVIESPQWLSGQGKPQTAKHYLKRIRHDDYNLDGEVNRWSSGLSGIDTVNEEEALLDAEQASHEEENIGRANKKSEEDSNVGVLAILRHPLHRQAVVVVVALMLAQQLCGINSIIMYSVSLLSTLLPTTSTLLTVLISVVNLVVTVVCAPLADRIGRKPCLLISVAGMGLNALVLAVSLHFSMGILSAVAALLFVVFFAIGMGPVPFMLSTELVSQEAVGAAQSWALAGNLVSTFLVAQFFPVVNNALGRGRVFYIFATFAALFFLFILWRVPESKGKKDADEVWNRKAATA